MNSNVNPDGEDKIEKAIKEKEMFFKANSENYNIAEEIYDNNINKKGDKISKAIIAQILADEIENRYCKEKEEFKSKLEQDSYVKYLIEAIKFLGE